MGFEILQEIGVGPGVGIVAIDDVVREVFGNMIVHEGPFAFGNQPSPIMDMEECRGYFVPSLVIFLDLTFDYLIVIEG